MIIHPNRTSHIPGNSGGTFDPSFPWRVVLHTTEGSSIEGAVAAYRQHNSWAHLTADPARRLLAQHVPLDVAARALEHPNGTPQTNKARTIQVELTGFAAGTHQWSDTWLDWIGGVVLAPIMSALGVPPVSAAFTDNAHVVRFDRAQWRKFSGVCGHQHVPDQRAGHWDPGRLNVSRILTPPTQVAPMFIPPIAVPSPFVAEAWPQVDGKMVGHYQLTEDGRVYAWGFAKHFGAPYGQPYWGGRKAARLEVTAAGYTVVAATGERYDYGP